MPTTGIRGNQIKDDSLTGDDIDESTLILNQIRDADGDTKVQVEESADEDKIRFDTVGVERAVLDSTELLLNVPIHVMGANPDQLLTLNGIDDNSEPYIAFTEGNASRAKIGINSSNNLEIQQQYTNKHIVFKVNDGGVTREAFRMDGAVPEVVVNQTSDSLVDFRVESDSNTHMLFVDGGNNRVGINTNVPVCELDVNGTIRTKAFGVQVRDVNSTSSVQAEDYCLRCIQTGAITITLPAKAQNVGRMLIIKDALGNASGNNITVDGDGSDTIDGSSTYVINRNGEAVTILCDGINGWMLVSRIVP